MDQLAGVEVGKQTKPQTHEINRTNETYALLLLLVALVAFLGGPIGVFVEALIIRKNSVNNLFGKTIYVVAVIGILLGVYNTYSIINGYFIHPQPDSEISVFI
jgi:uncharacterized membrane protein YsdA (DUF1294 family)